MFLPMTMQEAKKRGWDEFDFICVTGDAYVDHPSFGIAIVSRLLESLGYRVGMIAQPNPQKPSDFQKLGTPKYGFWVNGGNIDSMVAHYTAAKRRRSNDAYTPGGKAGKRPDRAVTVYCNKLRELYPNANIVIGGLEASMRRFAHYDYWADKVMPSILVDSKADLLIFGMGEKQTEVIARHLAGGGQADQVRCRGVCYLTDQLGLPADAVSVASFAKVSENKLSYAKATHTEIEEQDHIRGKHIIQKQGNNLFLVQTPPMEPLSQEELDRVFALPFERMYHPSYEAMGGVDAIKEVEFSIMHNRGCFGNCNFCSIAFHQGRTVTCRSEQSVIDEAISFTKNPRFKGYISDVGGPSANFRRPSCDKQLLHGLCAQRKCLAPKPCPNLVVDHREYLDLLRKLRSIKGIKKVFVRSGLRYDYMMLEKDDTFMRELIEFHVSGQLKVAPEHCSPNVLDCMGKPHIEVYERFSERFYRLTKEVGKEQYLVPYLISSHPGSTLQDAVNLAVFLKKHHIRPEQVQDFYPTPGTVSTCMFYTGLDPYTLKPVFVPTTQEEKWLQRSLLQYFKPENRRAVATALHKAGREDLIGSGPGCLIPPERSHAGAGAASSAGRAQGAKNVRAEKNSGSSKEKGKDQRDPAFYGRRGRGRSAPAGTPKTGKNSRYAKKGKR
ncbi:YgiQ family radical SAM protein [Youxingia wuxianensis]|uniref:YgiQ family radical SAM protein n=1 Tax=Youxingia wuxianensis TaxID=2763678 RepID=A0A926EQ91_9FIRM|nr:YgiQ family radical SAM protein [Youxingia wuxianensis]MBC8584554.1 YgiQ family radical SAM protein [Youxingia wuxianensis]